MLMISSRYKEMAIALEGFMRSGAPLVAWRNGHYSSAGFADDWGLYYFIPKIAVWLGARRMTVLYVRPANCRYAAAATLPENS